MSHALGRATARVPSQMRLPQVMRASRLFSTAAPTARNVPHLELQRPWLATLPQTNHIGRRYLSTTPPPQKKEEVDNQQKGKELKQESVDEEERKYTTKQSAQTAVNDRPWQRGGALHVFPDTTSPDPSRGDQTKGRLLTTPTRLLKLILPMPFHPEQEYINQQKDKWDSKTVEPLALLVHPQQPLSYLERLIQAEVPPLQVSGGREKLPDVIFRAEADHEEMTRKPESDSAASNVSAYSGLGREGPASEKEAHWVRWSSSTEVGDFIRDAARGREFAVAIEGSGKELRVAVPSFKDRTHYMRLRLRRASREIQDVAKVKQDCDMIAHRGAHRLAQGGFVALGGYWLVVYYYSFYTDAGWDLVEPVTYLAGLATIMGGYLWFLFISRDLSYKAAMNITVTRRQNALYQERGVDLQRWENLVREANALRSEIKAVAAEYDVDWDEMKDLGGEEVQEVLEQEKKDKKKGKKDDDDDDDDGDGKDKKNKGKETASPKKEKDD